MRIFLLFLPLWLQAQSLILDPQNSRIDFRVKSFIMNTVQGTFLRATGSMEYNEKSQEIQRLQVIIDARSLYTNNRLRDTHLKAENYFNTRFFPQIIFNYEESLNGYITGEVLIKNQSRYITLKIKQKHYEKGTLTLKLEQTINRDNYGLSYGSPLLIGSDVELKIKALFKKML